jgi:secreted trypsin-like serine protease
MKVTGPPLAVGSRVGLATLPTGYRASTCRAGTDETCFGDSGGPNFLKDKLIVAGVTSFGKNGQCAGQGGVYRVDRADDLEWLEEKFGVTPP